MAQETADDFAWKWTKRVTAILMASVVFLIVVVFVWKLVSPKLNLYRANTEKQSVIAAQEAESKAAEFAARSRVTQAQAEADAEIIRAKGLKESQAIITETLTPEYLKYLYIQNLDLAGVDVIYVPTEAGLPILEAGQRGGDK